MFVSAGPLVLDMAKSINKDEGESVDIKCEVKGWPHPKVCWWYWSMQADTFYKRSMFFLTLLSLKSGFFFLFFFL